MTFMAIVGQRTVGEVTPSRNSDHSKKLAPDDTKIVRISKQRLFYANEAMRAKFGCEVSERDTIHMALELLKAENDEAIKQRALKDLERISHG